MTGPSFSGRPVTGDPFTVFGLDRSATLVELRAARRRLAFDLHPDRGGDAEAMRNLNEAFDACVGHLTNRRPLPPASSPVEPETSSPAPSTPPRRRGSHRFRDIERDAPSFTVDALPVETFEALLVVISWIGEVLDDDPPYVLECHLFEPSPCWGRLELVPDAGGSTVSITVARADGGEPVSAEEVRDVWVDQLNRLGQQQP